MALPTLLERLHNDPHCDSWAYLCDQLKHTAVPAHKVIDRVNELTELRSIIDATIAEYMEDALERMSEGEEIAGLKIKAGIKRRTVPDTDKAIGYLANIGISSEHLFEKKFVGVPAIEKLMKAEGFDKDQIEDALGNFVTVSQGAPSATFA